jgi:S-adenosylmethionine-diacylglycerol 3-amino-3-carboxypropyl transferase
MNVVTAPPPTPTDRIHQRIFNALYARSLLYNACWEDPALDRVALAITPRDSILVITSGGCNALDYAICGPAHVYAIDANPRQNALLELKIAAIRSLPYEDVFRIFGCGHHPRFTDLYSQHLRRQLSPFAQGYFDARGHWFTRVGRQGSFYFRGLAGSAARIAWLVAGACDSLRRQLQELLQARTLPEQQRIYDARIAPRLHHPAITYLLSRRTTMTLLGVPYAQAVTVEQSHPGGSAGFIRDCLRQVFRELPIWTNYFWTVYLRGGYTPDCCPEYLKPGPFAVLKAGLVDRISVHTATIADHLKRHAEPISKFVLLDHMDWMSSYQPQALVEEWGLIFSRAAPQARAIFRSAAHDTAFLTPLAIQADGWRSAARLGDCLRFDRQLADDLHRRDRVHTYASFHIADLQTR